MKSRLRSILLIAGVCLLVAAIAVFLVWQWNIHRYARQAQAYADTLRDLIPPTQGSFPEERRDNTMATLSLDGADFIGILEFPRCDSCLPVCADWEKTSQYPCRFNGSIYDRTIQIGATSQDGQYDFYREITVGDGVFFTDTEGNRYTYQVSDIRYEKEVTPTTLQHRDGALTLFIKNIYAFDYIVVYCDVLK